MSFFAILNSGCLESPSSFDKDKLIFMYEIVEYILRLSRDSLV